MLEACWLHAKKCIKMLKNQLVHSIVIFLALAYCIGSNMQAAPTVTLDKIQQLEKTTKGDVQKRARAWGNLIVSVQNKPVSEQLEKVNSFFNLFNYSTDMESHGVEDYWESPDEFIKEGGGDCEDFAIIKYFTLVLLGVPSDKLRITYVTSLTLNQAHMVLSYYENPEAEPLILDSLENRILKASKRPDLKPVYSFNGDGLWLARQRGQSSLVGQSSSLGQWDDVLKRMQQ
ncbi:MAG: hypothetical protein EPN84_11340 [Legionella sp.]|nr:MAG: hypothetical protein EPN84_11340 [Legionella sp.]